MSIHQLRLFGFQRNLKNQSIAALFHTTPFPIITFSGGQSKSTGNRRTMSSTIEGPTVSTTAVIPPLSYRIVNPMVVSSVHDVSYMDICNAASTIKTIWVLQQQQQQLSTWLSATIDSTTKTTSLAMGAGAGAKSVEGHWNSNSMPLFAASTSNCAYAATTVAATINAPISVMQNCHVDDYCEYEQATLQVGLHDIIASAGTSSDMDSAQKKIVKSKLTTLCQRLEQALSADNGNHSRSSPYILNNTMTVADIAIATTLWQFIQLLHIHTKTSLQSTATATATATSTSEIPGDVDSTSVHIYDAPLKEFFSVAIQKYLTYHYVAYRNAHDYAVQLQQDASQATTSAHDINVIMKDPSLMRVADTVFRNTVEQIFSHDVVKMLPKIIIKPCSNPKHGDYQFSAAMPIFAAISKSADSSSEYKGPMDVAQAIVTALGANHPIVTDITTQGPGFILCRISIPYLQYHMNQYLVTNQLPMPKSANANSTTEEPKVCVVDFSSPNIAKEMHVGHLRSTIIGECICRILESCDNCIVHRINHVGDWGTQFGMLIQYLKEEYPSVVDSSKDTATDSATTTKSNATTNDLPNITDLTQFYKNAKNRFDESAEFKKVAQLNVVKLQSGDVECMNIWKLLCNISRLEFDKVYKRLDVTCTEVGESFYNDKISPVIDEFVDAKMIQIEEGGAKCVFVPKYAVPLMLQKSDGGYGYDSTDMAALKYRLQVLNAQRVIYITDFTQGDHFKMVFLAGEQIGWLNRGQQLQHIGFGTVQGEDGKRFKTRSGDTVRLVDLLDEAVHRMETELRTRIEEGKANITLDELHDVAEAIGYGAVKYFDLRRNPTSNYKFSYDQMLDTKGDTAVYLLYTRVRLESIVAKAATEHNIVVDELIQNGTTINITHTSERNLALQLLNYTDMMDLTLDDLYPYHICEYVYKLATAASDFVTQCRVLNADDRTTMSSRILLCHVTTNAMRYCFDLLGIRHVKRI